MNATTVTLLPYERRWLAELMPMWRASFEAGVGITDPNPLPAQQQYFLDRVEPRYTICVAVRDTELVGFVAATAESIGQLYVRVGCQRAGVGTQMLDWAKARSGGSLWLYTFAQNRGARTFYEKHGFVAVAFGFEPQWRLDDVRYEWTNRPPSQRA